MTTAELHITAAQTDSILDVTDSMMKTGHTVTVSQDGDEVIVNGDKRAALGRCAVITDTGDIEWIF